MKVADFIPIWGPFAPNTVTEGQGLNIPLPVSIRAIVNLDPGEDHVAVREEDYPFITLVLKDGVVENNFSWSVVDGQRILYFTPTMDDVGILEIIRTGTINCSIFAGTIVPGLQIKNTSIAGIVGNIPYKDEHSYRFGIRAEWEGEVADCIVNWPTVPVENQITWNYSTLPAPQTGPQVTVPFYSLGEYRRGQTVEVTFDLFNPDTTPFEMLIRSSDSVITSLIDENGDWQFAFNGSLPVALTFTNDPQFTIYGYIPADAVPGEYYFEVYTNEPLGPPPIVMHIRILGTDFDAATAINQLTWVSQENLGTLQEGLPSHITLKAVNSIDPTPVTYSLATGSRQLPVGMVLSESGELRGIVPHVPADTTFEFTAKASSGPYVITRKFTFRVKNSFVVAEHLVVRLPMSGPVRAAWLRQNRYIDDTRRFRPNDPLYGRAFPHLLLIRGLRKLPIPNLDFDKRFNLIIGPPKIAKAVMDGVHVYDVIYREFFDPMQNAGGFIADPEEAVLSPALYPQDSNVIIFEGTLNNLRKELVLKVGLNTLPAKQRKLGLRGGELLDPWMTSTQDNGKIPGYVGAAIIDYILPGQAQFVLQELDEEEIRVGEVVRFDRLQVETVGGPFHRIFGADDDGPVYSNLPLQPLDFRVDGVPMDKVLDANHPTPQLSWQAAELGVTYELKISSGGVVLRTETDLASTNFSYTNLYQIVDGNPGTITVELRSNKDGVLSDPLTVTIVLYSGWGRSWGFRYGGAV